MALTLDTQRIALQVAEKLREIATRQGNVPFLTGDLRKSHTVQPLGTDGAVLSANTPYARAVHDGRPRVVIRPKGGKKMLAFPAPQGWTGPISKKTGKALARQVVQPARPGNPWLHRSINTLRAEGLGFLRPHVRQAVVTTLSEALRSRPGFEVTVR